MNLLFVAVGGFFGACFRYSLSLWLNGKGRFQTAGTWLANISGSILLAVLWAEFDNGMSEWIWLLAGVGFSGAFTTFSTFGKETVDMIGQGKKADAAVYILLTIFVSMITVWCTTVFFNSIM